VRADQTTSRENLNALAKAQAEIDKLRSELNSVRTEAPPGTERLAQGEGTFILPVYAKGRYKADDIYTWRSAGDWTEVRMTWNRVFGYLGLRMMQEASNATLEEDLSTLVELDHRSALTEVVQEKVREAAKANHLDGVSLTFDEARVADEDFQTILLQFRALGLVQQSTRGRSVKDTANYWTLTPYGHTRLVQLRAIPGGTESLARGDSVEDAAVDQPGAHD
jgi:hypothetical protein